MIPPDEYEKLPEEEKQRMEAVIAGLQERLEKILRPDAAVAEGAQ